jgi:hypothetical protein
MDAKTGDRISVESERTGRGPRQGEIVEVLDAGGTVHYRVQWDDGHESTLFPSAGSVTIIPKRTKAGRR